MIKKKYQNVITLVFAVALAFFLGILLKSHILNSDSEDSSPKEYPCSSDNRSNQSWIKCEQDALSRVNNEKKKHFENIMELFRTDKKNVVLINDDNENKDFLEWYKGSFNNNHSKCLAIVYWTKAGSAYEGNLAHCEKEEALKVLVLIDELVSNFKSQDWE